MPVTDIYNFPVADQIGEFGETDISYVGQTFVAAGDRLRSLDFAINDKGPGATKYHLLITTIDKSGADINPGKVLKEISFETDAFDPSQVFNAVHIEFDDLDLVKGETYAFILDSYVARDGVEDKAYLGIRNAYNDGFYFYYNVGVGGGGRAEHFAGDWVEKTDTDLSFEAVFSDKGVTIHGTRGNDRIDASHAPGKQPFATVDDDIINGKKGNDRASGGAGYDLLFGGNGRDRLHGGDDPDFLDGGRGRDKLFGGADGDCFFFGFKMTKNSARKNWDKILDFNTDEDTVYLSHSAFHALAPGELPDSDTHVTYDHGVLFYNGMKFAKFVGAQPTTLDDIHIVIVA
ncbi:MAG: hypothetical protein KDJ88_16290 [Bauldia sp.]|nr:hypothetical protein [Bauldia sp.]